ncbi:hypothetical protein FHS27_004078 [Rhodopirellula rubra]|uniref:Uncharacterized protein n=1 Tax=Aporhodopirellula rubra TaxID=980271 RepID=A0A7W5H7S1_9BACT|nr:hypothetical protein [Aporhodopirellula rubra]
MTDASSGTSRLKEIVQTEISFETTDLTLVSQIVARISRFGSSLRRPTTERLPVDETGAFEKVRKKFRRQPPKHFEADLASIATTSQRPLYLFLRGESATVKF